MRHALTMADHEPERLHGAISLLEECRKTVASLFARWEGAEDAREKSRIAEAALYELKIHDAIAELALPPGMKRRDESFAALSVRIRRHALEQAAL